MKTKINPNLVEADVEVTDFVQAFANASNAEKSIALNGILYILFGKIDRFERLTILRNVHAESRMQLYEVIGETLNLSKSQVG